MDHMGFADNEAISTGRMWPYGCSFRHVDGSLQGMGLATRWIYGLGRREQE